MGPPGANGADGMPGPPGQDGQIIQAPVSRSSPSFSNVIQPPSPSPPNKPPPAHSAPSLLDEKYFCRMNTYCMKWTQYRQFYSAAEQMRVLAKCQAQDCERVIVYWEFMRPFQVDNADRCLFAEPVPRYSRRKQGILE